MSNCLIYRRHRKEFSATLQRRRVPPPLTAPAAPRPTHPPTTPHTHHPTPPRPPPLMQAVQLCAAVDALVQPISMCGSPAPGVPAMATLPLASQANLLLLLRAVPHRFTSGQRAAVLACVAQLAAIGASGARLLHILTADTNSSDGMQAEVPQCPDFLFCREPCFPWAPVLADSEAAAALQQQLAAASAWGAQGQPERGSGDGAAKRRAEGEAVAGSATKRQKQAAVAAPRGAAAAADAELQAAVQAVRRALASHAAGGSGELRSVPAELRVALGVLMSHTAAGTAAGAAAMAASGLGRLEDDSLLLLLTQELISPASSFARCSVAAGALLLPRLQGLQGAAPRDLAAAVEHVGAAAVPWFRAACCCVWQCWRRARNLSALPCAPVSPLLLMLLVAPTSCPPPPCPPRRAAKSSSQAFITACLRPLLTSSSGLGKHQAELIVGALKSALPTQLLPEALSAACCPPAAAPDRAAGSNWNEHVVGVLQAVLNAKPALSAPAVAQLAGALRTACTAGAELTASARFAKLALTLAKQYAAEASAVKPQLQEVAAACTSFMAKSLAAAVAKL